MNEMLYQDSIQYGMFYYGKICERSLRKQMLEFLSRKGYDIADITRNGRWTYLCQPTFGKLASSIKVTFDNPRGVMRVA